MNENKTLQRFKKGKDVLFNTVRILFLLALSYIILFQLCYMISYAIRPASDSMDPSIIWVPKNLTFENFKDAFIEMDYLKSFFNTLLVCVVSAFIEVAVCAVIGYGFARFDFPEKKIVFFLVMVTIIIPPQMIMAPTFVNYSHLDVMGIFGLFNKFTGIDLRPNILDTPFTFYIPSILGVGIRSGLFIYIYRQFFIKLPNELEEAAWVDGAGPLRTFISIIIPSSGVVVLTVTIFSLIWHWNDYYNSSMYLSDMSTLATKLSSLANLEGSELSTRNIRMAASLLFLTPVLIVYLILQKRFIKSIDRVGIVG